MPTLIVRYCEDEIERWAVLEGPAPSRADDEVRITPLDIETSTTASLITAFETEAVKKSQAITLPASRLISPITDDGTILCQALNYREHAAEAQHAIRKSNLIFAKASSSITGPYDSVVRPSYVELLDYEVEFGIVIRNPLMKETRVTDKNIGDFVAGIVLANDVSARDTMFGASFMQWFMGKSERTFCPIGPTLWLLNRGEVADALKSIEISLWLNGDLRQNVRSTEMIYDPAVSLTDISRHMNMKRGDLLLTGTPGGVTTSASPKLIQALKDHLMDDEARVKEMRIEMTKGRAFMKPGDICSAEMKDIRSGKSLGGLANIIVAG
jgi:2-keto-4-pentenoate hydratase/2-oxohepta-3-ene-1,7-dioic acid hydratase in catechol pathway